MLLQAIATIVNYDVRLYARKGGELVTSLGFYLIAASLFAFGMGAGNPHLAVYAPAFLWIVALLASLISIPHIFHRDQQDGTLDQLRLCGVSLEWCALAKCAANWIGCQLPLILVSPLAGLMLGMGEEQAARLALSLLVATPVLCAIGAMGSALTLHAANRSGVISVVVLPLYLPVLIFATRLAQSAPQINASHQIEMLALLAYTCAALPLSCWACAGLIRIQD